MKPDKSVCKLLKADLYKIVFLFAFFFEIAYDRSFSVDLMISKLCALTNIQYFTLRSLCTRLVIHLRSK